MKRIVGKLLIIVGLLTIGTVLYINYKTTQINQSFVTEYKDFKHPKDRFRSGYKKRSNK